MKPARLFLAAVVFFIATTSFGQQSFMDEPGIPAFTTAFPVEHGFINLANGNLHIEIPIATYPQRGNIKALHARLVYDSRFWSVRTDPVSGAQRWVQKLGGFRLITDGEAGVTGVTTNTVQCGCINWTGTGPCQPQLRTTYNNFTYQEPNGTFHRTGSSFKLYQTMTCTGQQTVSSGTAYANDASGYKFVINDFSATVFAPDGTQVAPGPVQDTNGNFFTTESGQAFPNVVDTLGRTPVVTTYSNNQTFLDYLCEQGCNPTNGDRARVTLNTEFIPFSTHFNYLQEGTLVGEYSGLSAALASIVFPDGTSYQFQYDTYGQITGITLPTGGQISYTYDNFSDFTGYVNRWVTSRTVDGNTWNFAIIPFVSTCTTMPCPMQVTVTTPSYNDGVTTAADTRVYTFATSSGIGGSGSWLTQTQYFRGPASGNPVLTKTTDYGVAGACPATPSLGNANGLPIRDTFIWPTGSGTMTKKAEYCYDSYGNKTATKEWDYQLNGNFAATPDRETDTTYKTDPAYLGANIINLPMVSTSFGPGHTQTAQTTYGYDETGLQPSGVTTNLATPTGPRANLTSTSKWLNTSTTPVISNTTWYDSGEIYESKDPLLHKTTTYYDSTGAYPNQVCNALNQCSYPVRDFNTGLMTSFTDVNGSQAGDPTHTTTYTFDTLLRPLCTNLPDGGQTCLSYPDANHVSRTQIITSALSDLSTTILDGLGRVSQTQHTLPAGISTVDTHYDEVGSPSTVSNPYFTSSDPTYGITQHFHDALGRTVKTIKQDGSISTAAYSVGNATTANGTCVTSTDEAGNPRMACHNGFGELVEVDEPGGPDPGVQATVSVSVRGAFNSTWVAAGTPHLAATGTALASVTMSDGSSHDFYFDTNLHLCRMSWISGSGWSDQDLTSMTEAALPLAGSSLAAVALGGVIHVFYQGANQHIYDMNWTGSNWQNLDMTAITGASPVSNTKMAIVDTGGSNTPMMFYEGTNQHLFCVYWNAATTAWQNADLHGLSGATNLIAPNGSISAAMWGTTGNIHALFLDTNQNLNRIVWSGTAWLTNNLTSMTGAAVATAASKLTTIPTGTPIDLMTFYEGAGQHIYSIYWNNSAGAYQTLDFTSWSGATNIAATLTSLANNPVGPHMFYFSSNQHLYDMLWNGSAWINADLTSLANTTAVPASGSSLSSHGPSGGNTYNIFFEGANQHIYHTYYNPGAPGWFNEDPLVTASNFVVDSGTVSLTIPNGSSNFTATVCYGVSTNPICAGQPVNATPGDIANALAAMLNGAGSPVNAVVTNSTTLNLTWRTVGVVTTTVAPMTSTPDNAALFPNGSFTSTSGTFSGGIAASNQSIRNPFVTQYQYDGLGNLSRVDQKGTAPNDSTQWRTRTFAYDSLSRLLTANNPESGTITYSYDTDGDLLQKTSPAPNQTGAATQTVSYCYDELHRVTGKGYGAQSCPLATPVVTYAYDSGTNGKGHLTSLADQAGTGTYGYDTMGRITTETRVLAGANNSAISKSISYDYNLDGSLYKLHYPSGSVVTYEAGAAGLTLSAKDTGNNINYVTSATYGPDSALTGFVSGNSTSFAGMTNAFSYNKRLQPVNMSASAPNQTVFSIGYDFHVGNGTSGADNGNVFGIMNYRDQTRNQTFTYDALNRLASARNAGTDCTATVLGGLKKFWGNNYTYDAWGNLIGKSVLQTPAPPACAGENLSVTADGHNWIHATGGSDYQYDAAGNMTFNATPPTQTYTYDQENRLTGAAGYAYTYAGDGNRVRKSNSSSTGTLYWHMTPGIVGESNLSGNLTDEYVFFDGERVARKSTNGVFYYFSDHLKTASVITDAAGVIKAESDYYPWGGEFQFVANDSNHYKFTGKERDSETQLDYFGARYYSNGLGRWVSADWSATPAPVPYADFGDPQSLNQYGYARNIPTTRIDPDGHCTADGEKHNVLWCIGHALGINETEKEKRERIEGERAILLDPKHTAHENGKPLTPAERHRIEHMTPEQVDSTYKALQAQGIQAGSPPPVPGGLRKWNYGNNKSAQKWQNQMSQRGWTEQQIDEAIAQGKQIPATNNINPANGATRYVHPTTGRSIVVDNATGELIHVGGDGFKY